MCIMILKYRYGGFLSNGATPKSSREHGWPWLSIETYGELGDPPIHKKPPYIYNWIIILEDKHVYIYMFTLKYPSE